MPGRPTWKRTSRSSTPKQQDLVWYYSTIIGAPALVLGLGLWYCAGVRAARRGGPSSETRAECVGSTGWRCWWQRWWPSRSGPARRRRPGLRSARFKVWPGSVDQVQRIEWTASSRSSWKAARTRSVVTYVGAVDKSVQVIKPSPDPTSKRTGRRDRRQAEA